MSFHQHLFISYAHIDNQPLSPEQQGWVTRFHRTLEAMLSMRMGGKAKIWRDEKLQGNDIFANEIVEQFPRTALFISIVTPRYLQSEWCTKEINEFCQTAQQTGGLVVGNQARVFKVIKTPVDAPKAMPALLDDLLGYEFFTYEDEVPLELDPAYGEAFAQGYNRKVGKLAWDIARLLKEMDDDDDPTVIGGHTATNTKPTVYLAECSYDQREHREALASNLQHHGYLVLPNQPLPRDEQEYRAAVTQLLERSQISIHLVGSTYGAVPDGPSMQSVVMLQNQLALQHSLSGEFPRLIWVPAGTESQQPLQQDYLAALQQDAKLQAGADLITGDLEVLKTSIHSLLHRIETDQTERLQEQTEAETPLPLIYFICEARDRKPSVPVRKYLKQQGCEVKLPLFTGDATAVRQANQDLLSRCDAILVFYGAGDEAWKRSIEHDLKKMAAYREGQPLLAQYTYLAEPSTFEKEDLIDLEEPNLIDGLDQFDEAALGPFMQALRG